MADKEEFHKKIVAIQSEFKSPKNRTISVKAKSGANYSFKARSAEDIQENLKPYLKKYELAFSANDQMVEIGGRIFDRSIVQLTDGENVWQAQADIAHLETGQQNTSQASGSTISYARKYALGGLLGLDDGEDADDEKYQRGNQEPQSSPNEPKLLSDKQQVFIDDLLEVANKEIALKWYKEQFGSKPIGQLTSSEAKRFISYLKGE